MCIEFNRGDDTRTKISKRENCTYRDVNKYLQIQIQEKYSKEKLFQVVELILQHVACNARAISSQEWTASKNPNYRWLQPPCNTWNYLQGTRFRLLCDIFKFRQKQDMGWGVDFFGFLFFFKKRFGHQFEVRPVFLPCLPSKKGQNSCHWSPIPPHSSRASGKSGNLLWALNSYKEVCSTHLAHWDISVTGFRDREEPVTSHT